MIKVEYLIQYRHRQKSTWRDGGKCFRKLKTAERFVEQCNKKDATYRYRVIWCQTHREVIA